MPKYVVVTGGVLSGLGKGIVTASIGRILKSRGLRVTAVKIDPYINIDAGTLRPTEHGEVWVTEDGGEIDQDFGHYERFLGQDLSKHQNLTTGKVFLSVIESERKGDYLGKTVQMIPHITDEVKRRLEETAKKTSSDVVLVEIGGTVGDYENILYLEAVRQMYRERRKDFFFVHLTYLPIPAHLGEMKTKPTQQSVRMLMQTGIHPDMIICRSEKPIDDVRKKKIEVFCDVDTDYIICEQDVGSIYEVPIILENQGVGDKITEKLGIKNTARDMKEWKDRVEKMKRPRHSVKIGIVGKYLDIGSFNLTDAYVSISEALKHAGASLDTDTEIVWIDSKALDKGDIDCLKGLDGIIVPGGFGSSGVEGKITAVRYAREKDIPFLGLCYGLQLAVIEFARNVCGLTGANSTEIDQKTKYPLIDILPEQKDVDTKGGTMRLGAYPAFLMKGTKTYDLYKKFGFEGKASERHRHRYEVNPEYHKILEERGLVISGKSPDGRLVEFIELPGNGFFMATQGHPEFKSNFLKPAPLFYGLVEASIKRK